jgi:hypothetical protein
MHKLSSWPAGRQARRGVIEIINVGVFILNIYF